LKRQNSFGIDKHGSGSKKKIGTLISINKECGLSALGFCKDSKDFVSSLPTIQHTMFRREKMAYKNILCP
jgi:hypothetical protein